MIRHLGFLLIAFALVLSGLGNGAAAETVFKLNFTTSLKSHFGAGATAFAREIAARSQGRYRIEMFPESALGAEREAIEKTQLGTIELDLASTGPFATFIPATQVFDIPFLFRDSAHARAVLDGPIGQQVLAEFPKYGLIGLAWGENGFRHLTNNVRPIVTPDDIRGLKIRTMQNAIFVRAFTALGARPVPIAYPQLYAALRDHVVDGQENPIAALIASRLAEVQKYLSLTAHVYSPAVFFMSAITWETLNEADRRMFVAAAEVGRDAMRAEVDRMEKEGLDILRAAGMTVTSVDRSLFERVLAPVFADYARQFSQQRIDSIRNFR